MSAQRQRSVSSRPSQRVFWARRLLVGGTLFAVLFGVGRFLLAEGGPDTGQQATAAAAKTKGGSDQQSSQAQVFGPQPVPFDSLGAPTASAIAEPEIPSSGPCSDSAITATPEVVDAVAGRPVVINLKLTGTLPACSFKAGPKTLAVKITSGKDPIWSSMDCPRSIPSQEVVVRAGTPAVVPVHWSGRRSDEYCSKQPSWALPGFYHVEAATLGSVPSDVQFEVKSPTPRVIVKTQKPKPDPMPDGQDPRTLPAPID